MEICVIKKTEMSPPLRDQFCTKSGRCQMIMVPEVVAATGKAISQSDHFSNSGMCVGPDKRLDTHTHTHTHTGRKKNKKTQ